MASWPRPAHPKEVVAKLSDAFKQVLTTPDVRNRMITQGADPAFLGRTTFAKFLAAEMPRWAEAVKKRAALQGPVMPRSSTNRLIPFP
jgi:tripartite-type tricarboxylate transporter receptor subunit TctC